MYGDDESNYPADDIPDVVYTLSSTMNFLTAGYPGGSDLLKKSIWEQPKNVLKVENLGYTYSESTFGRKKRSVNIKHVVQAASLSVSTIRAIIASKRPTQIQVAQWDFDTQCFFQSDRLTPSQQDLCIHRGIMVCACALPVTLINYNFLSSSLHYMCSSVLPSLEFSSLVSRMHRYMM